MPDQHDNIPLVNWTHHNLTLNFASQMVQADLTGSKERYFKACVWFLRMLTAYLTDSERKLLEKDLELLDDEITATKEKYKTDEAARTHLLNLKESFANSHVALGFATFSRSGIVYPSDDGEIDFDKLALAQVQKIVQTPFGIDKGLDRAIARTLKPEAKPIPPPPPFEISGDLKNG